MSNPLKEFLLKYGIASLAVVVIMVHFFLVNTQNLNRWKGGGYGMYTEIHYTYNKLHIPGMSIDSLITDSEMKAILGRIKIMPNDDNLKKAAEFVMQKKQKNSIHIQIWKPTLNTEDGMYTRVLFNEIYLKKPSL
jgi:hypothetical protein